MCRAARAVHVAEAGCAMSLTQITGMPNEVQRARLRKALDTWPSRLGYRGRWYSKCRCAWEYLALLILPSPSLKVPGYYGVNGIISENDSFPSETQMQRAARMKALLAEIAKEPGEEI